MSHMSAARGVPALSLWSLRDDPGWPPSFLLPLLSRPGGRLASEGPAGAVAGGTSAQVPSFAGPEGGCLTGLGGSKASLLFILPLLPFCPFNVLVGKKDINSARLLPCRSAGVRRVRA